MPTQKKVTVNINQGGMFTYYYMATCDATPSDSGDLAFSLNQRVFIEFRYLSNLVALQR